MKTRFSLYFILIFLGCISCNNQTKSQKMDIKKYKFDLQGHRGARGILPENSLEAFQKALDLGVTTLELDVVISKDSMVVVSHEAYMNPKICQTPQGKKVVDSSAFNLYDMPYSAIQAFDCGSLGHPEFPEQKKLATHKPLLSEVIQMTTKHLREKGKRPGLNIEIKSTPETDSIFHPAPKEFVDLVVKTIKNELIPLNKITLQSFDKRVISYIIDNYPEFKAAYLVYEGTFYDNLSILGKTPQIYSPHYSLLDSIQVKQAHDSGLKVIPWTVNELEDMKNLLEMGVDGIITDYPNRAKLLHL